MQGRKVGARPALKGTEGACGQMWCVVAEWVLMEGRAAPKAETGGAGRLGHGSCSRVGPKSPEGGVRGDRYLLG